MRDKIKDYLLELCPGVDFETENDLVENEILDSFAMIQLITFLMEEFSVELDASDIEPEAFENLDAICTLVESKQAGK